MKRIAYVLVLLILTSASIAAQAQNRALFFEGRTVNQEQQTFFMDNFRMEAEALGYTVVNRREEAGYTFRFEVSPNLVLYSDGTMAMAPPDEDQFIIQITMVSNADSVDMASFSFGFTNLYEMYDYTQFLVVKGVVYIPAAEEGPAIVQGPPEDDSWRNKWLYIRTSIDFPTITIYESEIAVAFDATGTPTMLDNIYNVNPNLTLGLEFQFLNFMSVEPKIHIGYEVLHDTSFISLTAGFDLKFPLKFMGNIMLEPYASATYPFYFFYPEGGDLFAEPPFLGIGGGLQLGIKGGSSEAFFIDFSYMRYFLNDTVLRSEYTDPETVPYIRSVYRFSIGYKFGFINRK